MKKFAKLDKDLLNSVKSAFVSMPPGSDPSMGAGPVAGGGMLTQAQASPMGGTPQGDPAAMAGGDPAAMGGAPMDPAMMGGAPMDPAMMGGDPAAMAAAGGAPADAGAGAPPPPDAGAAAAGGSTSQIMMTVPDLIALIQAIQASAGGAAKPKAPKTDAGGATNGAGGNGNDTSAKLDQIISILGGNMMSGAGAPPPQQ